MKNVLNVIINIVLMDYFGYVMNVRKNIKPATCECGRMVNKLFLTKHLKTEIHKKNI